MGCIQTREIKDGVVLIHQDVTEDPCLVELLAQLFVFEDGEVAAFISLFVIEVGARDVHHVIRNVKLKLPVAWISILISHDIKDPKCDVEVLVQLPNLFARFFNSTFIIFAPDIKLVLLHFVVELVYD